MKKYIKNTEAIYCMATVGRNLSQNFTVAVNPDSKHIGLCYLKYYNSNNYKKADKVIRLNLKKPEKIYHTNFDGKENWEINSQERKMLCQFLDSQSKQFPEFTYWQLTLYHWNNEYGFLLSDYPDAFANHIEAFISGFYDDLDESMHPSYMFSGTARPDYMNLLN